MRVEINYAKLSMSELHLCQLEIMREIQECDRFSHRKLENTMKQSESLVVQLKEVEQRKRDAERKQATLVRVLDEACRSLPDFDVQLEEEPDQRITKLKDYVK